MVLFIIVADLMLGVVYSTILGVVYNFLLL